jgi:hypothetical protein
MQYLHTRNFQISKVAIQTEASGQAPVDRYAQLRFLLSFDVISQSGRVTAGRRELVFVRVYRELAAKDVVTGFTRLRWEQPESKQYGLVSVDSILRLVHMLPNFSSDGMEFFLNRTLFEHSA